MGSLGWFAAGFLIGASGSQKSSTTYIIRNAKIINGRCSLCGRNPSSNKCGHQPSGQIIQDYETGRVVDAGYDYPFTEEDRKYAVECQRRADDRKNQWAAK